MTNKPHPDNVQIGFNLMFLRLLRGKTTGETAKEFRIDEHTYLLIELGFDEPYFPTTVKLQKGLGYLGFDPHLVFRVKLYGDDFFVTDLYDERKNVVKELKEKYGEELY